MMATAEPAEAGDIEFRGSDEFELLELDISIF